MPARSVLKAVKILVKPEKAVFLSRSLYVTAWGTGFQLAGGMGFNVSRDEDGRSVRQSCI